MQNNSSGLMINERTPQSSNVYQRESLTVMNIGSGSSRNKEMLFGKMTLDQLIMQDSSFINKLEKTSTLKHDNDSKQTGGDDCESLGMQANKVD